MLIALVWLNQGCPNFLDGGLNRTQRGCVLPIKSTKPERDFWSNIEISYWCEKGEDPKKVFFKYAVRATTLPHHRYVFFSVAGENLSDGQELQ